MLIYTSVLVAATRVASIQVVHLNMKVPRTEATSDYVSISSNVVTDLLVAE